MSKKDRNRDSRNFQKDFDLPEAQFDDITDSLASALKEVTDSFESSTAMEESDDEESDLEDEPSENVLLAALKSVGGVFAPQKIGAFFVAAAGYVKRGSLWSLECLTWLGSFLVLKGAASEEEETDEEAEGKPNAESKSVVADKLKAVDKAVAAKPELKSDAARPVAAEEMDEDDDFEGAPSWLGRGIKISALAAMAFLILGGGYYATKLFLPKKDIAAASNVESIEGNGASSVDKPNDIEAAMKAAANALAATPPPAPQPAATDPKTASNAAKTEEPKKPEPKPVPPPAPKPAENKKPESKPVPPPAPKPAETAKLPTPPEAKTPESKPAETAKTPKSAEPKKPEPKPETKTEVAASNPFDMAAAPQTPEAPKSNSFDPFAAPAPVAASAAPPAATDFWGAPVPPVASSNPAPALAEATPPSPPLAPANAMATSETAAAPALATLAPMQPTSDQAGVPAAAPPALPDLAPPPALATLQPLVAERIEPMKNEQAISIPDTSNQKFPSQEFTAIPTAPKSNVSVPNLSAGTPIQPVVKEPEVALGIPLSERVEPTADVVPLKTSPSASESLPNIPLDPTPSSTAAFATPSRTAVAPIPATASRSNAYVPPISQPPATQATPASMVLAPMSVSAPPAGTQAGDAIGIPNESFAAPVTTASLAPVQTAVPEPRAVAPSLPEHDALARTELPLGSQLQNQVRELRSSDAETPKLRYDTAPAKTEGAIRFKGTSTPAPLPMPTEQNGGLYALNPTGQTTEGASIHANALAALPAGPEAVSATPNPGYRRIIRSETPATVDASAASVSSEKQASVFRAQEITRSPSAAESYVVQNGDTYMTICDRFFGTSLLYRALAVHNRKRGAAWLPSPGTVIEIPTAEYLQTNYADVLSRSGRYQNAAPQTSNNLTRYVVREGDSVFLIATNQLQDSNRWKEIIELNPDLIRDARTELKPGTELLIPMSTTSMTQNMYGRR